MKVKKVLTITVNDFQYASGILGTLRAEHADEFTWRVSNVAHDDEKLSGEFPVAGHPIKATLKDPVPAFPPLPKKSR